MEIRKWYMKETIKNGWSHDVLADQIKYKLYERQAIAEKVTNFENTFGTTAPGNMGSDFEVTSSTDDLPF